MTTTCSWLDVMDAFADYNLYITEDEMECEEGLLRFARTFGDERVYKGAEQYVIRRRTFRHN